MVVGGPSGRRTRVRWTAAAARHRVAAGTLLILYTAALPSCSRSAPSGEPAVDERPASAPARRGNLDADAWIRNRAWLGEALTNTAQVLTGTDEEAIRAVETIYAAIILIGGADTRGAGPGLVP